MAEGPFDGARPCAPVYTVRRYGYRDFKYNRDQKVDLLPGEVRGFGDADDALRCNWYRLRMETEHLCANHNSYLATNYTNHCMADETWYTELYNDGCAFFEELGRRPQPRRATVEGHGGRVYKLTPADGFTIGRFSCPNHASCVETKAQWLKLTQNDPIGNRNFSTELVWEKSMELAKRLKARHPEARFSQIAYMTYADPPTNTATVIPDYVDVFVARRGPWAQNSPAIQASETNDVRAWYDRIGHRKVSLWNYPGKRAREYTNAVETVRVNGQDVTVTNRVLQESADVSIPYLDAPGIPPMAPTAWGEYYQSVSNWINGAFAECETDRTIQNYLNKYVFSRVCWDPSVDVRGIIAEHHVKMFGRASGEMGEFLGLLETNWMAMVSNQVVTSGSSVYCRVPSPDELRTGLYSPEVLAHLDQLLKDAMQAVGAESLEGRRVAFFRREFYDPLVEAMKPRLAWPDERGTAEVVFHSNYGMGTDTNYTRHVTRGERLGPIPPPPPHPCAITNFFGGWYSSPTDFSRGRRVDELTVMTGTMTNLYARWYPAAKAHISLNGLKHPNYSGWTCSEPESALSAQKWFGQAVEDPVSGGAGKSIRSGVIAPGESVEFVLNATNEFEMSFSWAVSSEKDKDVLSFEVDGVVVTNVSGISSRWESITNVVRGCGLHRARIRYSKDADGLDGRDAGYVRDILLRRPVTFDANGGPIQTVRRYFEVGYFNSNVQYQMTYGGSNNGGLPDYSPETGFRGWYTEPHGGREVVNTDVVPNIPHTLYAHWGATPETPSLTVTTGRDVVDAYDGLTSFREAVACAGSRGAPLVDGVARISFDSALADAGGRIDICLDKAKGMVRLLDDGGGGCRELVVSAPAGYRVRFLGTGGEPDVAVDNGLFSVVGGVESVTFSGLDVEDCSGIGAGAIRCDDLCPVSSVTITNCTFRNCVSAFGDGGAVRLAAPRVKVVDSSFVGNVQRGEEGVGGGLALRVGGDGSERGFGLVERCSFYDNAAESDAGLSIRGSRADDRVVVVNTSVLRNHANGYGTGMGVHDRADVSLVSSSVMENTTERAADGEIAAVQRESGAKLELVNSVVAGGFYMNPHHKGHDYDVVFGDSSGPDAVRAFNSVFFKVKQNQVASTDYVGNETVLSTYSPWFGDISRQANAAGIPMYCRAPEGSAAAKGVAVRHSPDWSSIVYVGANGDVRVRGAGAANLVVDLDMLGLARDPIFNAVGAVAADPAARVPAGFAIWAAAQGLVGADAAWDAKPSKWGGVWENAFVYTYGEGIVPDGAAQTGGVDALLDIWFDANGDPVVTTLPVVEGHTDFTAQVIGAPTLDDWSHPVLLNRNGNDWRLTNGQSARFFRLRLGK